MPSRALAVLRSSVASRMLSSLENSIGACHSFLANVAIPSAPRFPPFPGVAAAVRLRSLNHTSGPGCCRTSYRVSALPVSILRARGDGDAERGQVHAGRQALEEPSSEPAFEPRDDAVSAGCVITSRPTAASILPVSATASRRPSSLRFSNMPPSPGTSRPAACPFCLDMGAGMVFSTSPDNWTSDGRYRPRNWVDCRDREGPADRIRQIRGGRLAFVTVRRAKCGGVTRGAGKAW